MSIAEPGVPKKYLYFLGCIGRMLYGREGNRHIAENAVNRMVYGKKDTLMQYAKSIAPQNTCTCFFAFFIFCFRRSGPFLTVLKRAVAPVF